MRPRLMHLVSLAGLTLIGASYAQQGQGQGSVYTYADGPTTHQYGLLNGDYLSLYVNDRGDLGSPYFTSGTRKFAGFGPGGSPQVNTDGSVPQTPPRSYAMAYSDYDANGNSVSTAGAGSVGASVGMKHEYLTFGASNIPLENYSLKIGNTWINPLNDLTLGQVGSNPAFGVSGGSATSPLNAVSRLNYTQGSTNLDVTQSVSFQQTGDPNDKARVRFQIDFTNRSTSALNSFQYARFLNPNQGAPGNPATLQQFGASWDNRAFALNSSSAGAPVRNLSLGVLPSDEGGATRVIGSTIATSPVTGEAALLGNPNPGSEGLLNAHVTLTGLTSADYFDAGSIVPDPAESTTDFTTGLYNPPWTGGAFADDSMLLFSPTFTNLAPNQTASFVFYYFFNRPVGGASDVPEPGAPLLLLSLGVLGGAVRIWRRRPRK